VPGETNVTGTYISLRQENVNMNQYVGGKADMPFLLRQASHALSNLRLLYPLLPPSAPLVPMGNNLVSALFSYSDCLFVTVVVEGPNEGVLSDHGGQEEEATQANAAVLSYLRTPLYCI